MIPKIIHQSWKSTDLSSYGGVAIKSQDSWRKFHPDFEYKFWTDKDIDQYISRCPDATSQAFHALDKNIKKMDLFRYLVLHEFGGVYADLDFVLYQPLPLQHFSRDFIGYKACRNNSDHYDVVGLKSFTRQDQGEEGKWVLGNAFFGCCENHHGISSLIKNISDTTPFLPEDLPPRVGDRVVGWDQRLMINVLTHTGPEAIHRVFESEGYLDSKKTHVFSKKEMNNNRGSVGRHYRQHKW